MQRKTLSKEVVQSFIDRFEIVGGMLIYKIPCGPRATKGTVAGTPVDMQYTYYTQIIVNGKSYYAHVIIDAMHRHANRRGVSQPDAAPT